MAHFEYDAFGRTVVATGATTGLDIRFSTKPQDDATGWCYYGYRFYDAESGRWSNKDPIAERGELNLYNLLSNDGLAGCDTLGLIGSLNGLPPPPGWPGFDPDYRPPHPHIEAPDAVRLFFRFISRGDSPKNYSDDVWGAVFAGSDYIDYEKQLESYAKAEATPDCTTTFKSSLDSIDVETIAVGDDYRIFPLEGLAVGGYRLEVEEHEVKVQCSSVLCQASTKMTVKIDDEYSFPFAAHNKQLAFLNDIGKPFKINDKRSKIWSRDFSLEK